MLLQPWSNRAYYGLIKNRKIVRIPFVLLISMRFHLCIFNSSSDEWHCCINTCLLGNTQKSWLTTPILMGMLLTALLLVVGLSLLFSRYYRNKRGLWRSYTSVGTCDGDPLLSTEKSTVINNSSEATRSADPAVMAPASASDDDVHVNINSHS